MAAGEVLTIMTGDAATGDQHDEAFAPATVTLESATTAFAIPVNGYVFAQETLVAGGSSPLALSGSSSAICKFKGFLCI